MAATADSVLFAKSCSEAAAFPKNLARHVSLQNNLERYYNRLNEQSNRLFCEDGQAAVNSWEYDDNIEGFQSTYLSSHFELKRSIEGVNLFSRPDPKCRFVFIHANHSRDRLRISRRMLDAIFTYHQVMHSFLDFVFPFGMQDRLEDFYFSGLREETRLQLPNQGLAIPELGRSGRDLRLCYNLKSVETSNSNSKWPWSIRQMAVYHSFDVETGKTLWIILKGNQLMEERLQAATSETLSSLANLNSFNSINGAFASSLATHLLIAEWAAEEWRWYLNFLDKEIQHTADHSLVACDREPGMRGQSLNRETKSPHSNSFLRAITRLSKNLSTPNALDFSSLSNSSQLRMHGALADRIQNDQEEHFPTKHLRQMQFLEDKVNEIALVLQSDCDILTQLKENYSSVLESGHFPEDLKANCKTGAVQFEKRISLILADLQKQRLRTETLLKTLNDRKSLLSDIINYRSIDASLARAQKAQNSAERMESMTKSMHTIAEKTRVETVSMKIITIVTLLFLPATFISNIMNSGIVTFENNARRVQHKALQFYLALTIPLTLATLAIWYGMHLRAKRIKNANERDQRDIRNKCEAKESHSIV